MNSAAWAGVVSLPPAMVSSSVLKRRTGWVGRGAPVVRCLVGAACRGYVLSARDSGRPHPCPGSSLVASGAPLHRPRRPDCDHRPAGVREEASPTPPLPETRCGCSCRCRDRSDGGSRRSRTRQRLRPTTSASTPPDPHTTPATCKLHVAQYSMAHLVRSRPPVPAGRPRRPVIA